MVLKCTRVSIGPCKSCTKAVQMCARVLYLRLCKGGMGRTVQGSSEAWKCDPEPSSCPPLTAEQRISQIPVCHGIKYSHPKKVVKRMIICLKSLINACLGDHILKEFWPRIDVLCLYIAASSSR